MPTLTENQADPTMPASIGENLIPLTRDAVFDTPIEPAGALPGWLRELRCESWERFEALPMPLRTDENWRFANLRKVQLEGFGVRTSPVPSETLELLSLSNHIEAYSGKTIFADGYQVNHYEVSDELRRKGVIWEPLSEALVKHPNLVRRFFENRVGDQGSEKFLALHDALTHSGTFLYVPADVQIDLPFLAYHWGVTSGAALFPHTIVVAGENARVTMMELFESARPEARHFACGVANITAGPGSKVQYKTVQNWSAHSLAFHLNTVSADRDSTLRTINVHTGSDYCRNEQNNRVVGEGANIETYSLAVASGEQVIDQRTLQTHLAGNAYSNLLYKNALLDDARTIFSGLIRVEPEAQKTDAYQTNRNLLLSDRAEANSLPGLEIEANDVKCSHGATTGNLSQEELYYLRSRGLPLRQAQELLVFGFFEEILGKLEDENVAEWIRGVIRRKFE